MTSCLVLQHFLYSQIKDSGNRRGGKMLEQSVHSKNKLGPFMMLLSVLQNSTPERLQVSSSAAAARAEQGTQGRAAHAPCGLPGCAGRQQLLTALPGTRAIGSRLSFRWTQSLCRSEQKPMTHIARLIKVPVLCTSVIHKEAQSFKFYTNVRNFFFFSQSKGKIIVQRLLLRFLGLSPLVEGAVP